jgi:hypothetical protein
MTQAEVEKMLIALDGDIYFINKSLKEMQESLDLLHEKYEMLLNRVKCTECSAHNKKG